METHVSRAIIMRIREFGESDLLVTFFTYDRGKQKGVAKGGRKSRKRFANCLDLFCLVDLEYVIRKKGDLCFLYSCKLVHAFPGLRCDFSSLSLASYMIELTEILFPQNVVASGMFEVLKNSLRELEDGRGINEVRTIFEGKTISLGGYSVNADKCCRCGRQYTGVGRAVFMPDKGGIACLKCQNESSLFPGMGPDAVKVLKIIQSQSWENIIGTPLTDEAIGEIKAVLRLHIDYRIGRRMRSVEYLE